MYAKFLVLVAVLLTLVGCQGPQSVRNGKVTDVITNVERRASEYSIIWVRTDITSAYCTNDPLIIDDAEQYREFVMTVTIQYETIDFGERGGAVLGVGGCDHEMEGVRTYWINSLRLADIETTKTPPFLAQ